MVGPLDYQRLKLPLLMLESTTLILGYGLGDMNVRSAMALAQTFHRDGSFSLGPGQNLVVQALYNPQSTCAEPRYGADAELILEIASIETFLFEVVTMREQLTAQLDGIRRHIRDFIASNDNAQNVTSVAATRASLLQIASVAQWPYCATSAFLDFLQRCLDPLWQQAQSWYQFSYYNDYLMLLLDIVEQLNPIEVHPNLVAYLADALNRVAANLGTARGNAFLATATWNERAPRLRPELVQLFYWHAKAHNKYALAERLKPFAEPESHSA